MKTLIIRNVPTEVHAKAKAAAAMLGVSLQDFVIKAISSAITAEREVGKK